MAFLTLQKSLKAVTEQRIKMGDDLNKTRIELRKVTSQLDREQRQKRTHIAILEDGQSKQMNDKDGLLDDKQLALEEMEEAHTDGSTKSDGIRQMSTTISDLSAEKREYFQKYELANADLKLKVEELEELRGITMDREAELMAELHGLRATVDPKLQIGLAADAATGGSGVSNAQVAGLRSEIERLKDDLEIAHAQKTSASEESSLRRGSGVSNAALEKAEAETLTAKQDLARSKNDLNEARAAMAKMQAMASSGADNTSQAKAANDELVGQVEAAQKKDREAKAKIADLEAQISKEEAAKQRAENEVAELKGNIDQMGSQAAAGATSAEVLQNQIQAEKSGRASEKERAEAAENDLAAAKSEIGAIKSSMAESDAATSKELRESREQHANAIQTAQAQAAAALAEADQRAQDQMKDLQARLGSFGQIVAPMAATLKLISTNYRKLRTETRELSATIAPAVKQVRRDLLKSLAEIDTQYKEMLVKYRQEMKLRKKLHNELVDLKGMIRVYGRLRPVIKEDGTGPQAEVVCAGDKQDDEILHVKAKGKVNNFNLDRVFGMDATQDQVFNSGIADLIVSVMDGFNVCIFAYGQTGSGKTYSMEGNDENPGLNRRALTRLFDLVEEQKANWSFQLEVAVMEIYNEKLRDLLCGSKTGAGKRSSVFAAAAAAAEFVALLFCLFYFWFDNAVVSMIKPPYNTFCVAPLHCFWIHLLLVTLLYFPVHLPPTLQ
jgi:kinesin family protein C2/C3